MKLIFCKVCHDVVKLQITERQCKCGKCTGAYKEDRLNVVVRGPVVVLGIDNYSFSHAFRQHLVDGSNQALCAFIIPTNCEKVERVENV